MGLPNTRARLEALYGDAGALTLAPEPAGGVVATVTLPFEAAPRGDGADPSVPTEVQRG